MSSHHYRRNQIVTRMKSVIATQQLNAVLVLSDGTFFLGKSVGCKGETEGELCFNTGLTGYQETLTDPSYAAQIITFTFPHIGNVGCNQHDNESRAVFCKGVVMRNDVTAPSNFRAECHLSQWLTSRGVIGICDVDTRAITTHVRLHGPQHARIVAVDAGDCLPVADIHHAIKHLPNLSGKELSLSVTTSTPYQWDSAAGLSPTSNVVTSAPPEPGYHVVAIDYGIKHNILRCLNDVGFKVTVMPATSQYNDILAVNPDGVFLSNGPGDPWETAKFAAPTIQALLENRIPLFGICLGNQLLSIAAKLATSPMQNGHRGANQPVQDLKTKKIFITSQNHGFCVMPETLPDNIELTHRSLFDGTVEGIQFKDRPAFSVQFHPESSPGPHDCRFLFHQFRDLIQQHQNIPHS